LAETKPDEVDLPDVSQDTSLPENQSVQAQPQSSQNGNPEVVMRMIDSVTHSAAEFSNGYRENLVLTSDGLTIGSESTPTELKNDYPSAGRFLSPEQTAAEPFTFFKASCQATIPAGTGIIFEIRMK